LIGTLAAFYLGVITKEAFMHIHPDAGVRFMGNEAAFPGLFVALTTTRWRNLSAENK